MASFRYSHHLACAIFLIFRMRTYASIFNELGLGFVLLRDQAPSAATSPIPLAEPPYMLPLAHELAQASQTTSRDPICPNSSFRSIHVIPTVEGLPLPRSIYRIR